MSIFDIFKKKKTEDKSMPNSNMDIEWVKNGWSVATKLLSTLRPDIIPCVSKVPTMVFEDKFIIYYAKDPTKVPQEEYWIINGAFPPALIDAAKTENERDAIKIFGQIYQHDGQVIQGKITGDFKLPLFTIEKSKEDKNFGVFLENIGNYLCSMEKSFPWKEYGINGKVFSVE
ncbi:DUF4826 family protein [Acetivibrio cellulolyticus]|uniref:DUF4826 family protein n=1 Tax=Acetivibrio cellulolyticus TaxID=35830 RepID=UPI0001E305CC|nr:DUF4826 family protein [Acetivibrio cellulolyticus]